MCVSVCVCVYVCECLCVYVCIYILCMCWFHAQVKPFSDVISQLAEDLGVVKERILLSYKDDDVALNSTPDSLGLTTVDFLGEYSCVNLQNMQF